MTRFSFDFIPSALENYELHIKSPVELRRQWLATISAHFFCIKTPLTWWKKWLRYLTQFLTFCNSTAVDLFFFKILCFTRFWERNVIDYFSGTQCFGISYVLYILRFFIWFFFFFKYKWHVYIFLILHHLSVLDVVENLLLYLSATHKVKQWENEICRYICSYCSYKLRYFSFFRTSLPMICWAHEKLRDNRENVGWKESSSTGASLIPPVAQRSHGCFPKSSGMVNNPCVSFITYLSKFFFQMSIFQCLIFHDTLCSCSPSS